MPIEDGRWSVSKRARKEWISGVVSPVTGAWSTYANSGAVSSAYHSLFRLANEETSKNCMNARVSVKDGKKNAYS